MFCQLVGQLVGQLHKVKTCHAVRCIQGSAVQSTQVQCDTLQCSTCDVGQSHGLSSSKAWAHKIPEGSGFVF